ncbi:unnamed protein product [Ectocarpus sp. 4 AP-2014]
MESSTTSFSHPCLYLMPCIVLDQTKRTTFDAKTAQRFLLSPGDHFYVPVNNVYRLENHSDRAKVVIYWTIIKAGGEGLSDNEVEA